MSSLGEDSAAPLLENLPRPLGDDVEDARSLLPSYVDGCPGCALELKKVTRLAPPRKELVIVALVMLSTALPVSSLFPFVYFMVRDFGIAKSDTQIGSYAGYIGSALMFGRFLSSVPWGVIADKYGRKPVLVIGTASGVIFNTIFGFSKNFWLALVARFLLGLLNGVMGTVMAYASEICSEEHQPLGLSIVGTMWGVGLIIGPALGGYLAQPSEKYPSLFPSGSVFDRFPYGLPCLSISIIAMASLVISIWLPESIHVHKETSKERDKEKLLNHNEQKNEHNGDTNEPKQTQARRLIPLWRNLGWIAAVTLYCLWGLHDMAYSEIFSLWAVSPTSYGGLGFTTTQVGNVLAVCGATLLLFQIFFFPALAKKFGVIPIARYPILLSIPVSAIYPLIATLNGAVLWIVLLLVAIMKNLLSICVMTGSFIMINNSVTSAERGVANGTAMSCMSFFRTLAPAMAGIIFSWAEERVEAAFLPGMWMVFTILALLAFVAILSSFNPYLEKPSFEKQNKTQPVNEILRHHSSFTL